MLNASIKRAFSELTILQIAFRLQLNGRKPFVLLALSRLLSHRELRLLIKKNLITRSADGAASAAPLSAFSVMRRDEKQNLLRHLNIKNKF